MKPLLIIYFSGAGNTKAVSEYIKRCADEKYAAEIYPVEKLPDDFSFERYSAVIIGTPTYHSEPAKPLMDFVGRISPNRNIPAFIFATCGLYPENCLRILGKKCLEHSVVPIYYASYRCSASDGILLAPFMKCWFKNEKGLSEKIKKDVSIFFGRLKSQAKADMPRYRWYAPLNYPNKMLGKAVTFPIYLHKDRCVKCGKCEKNCPQSAVSNKDGYPVINRADCINCYRCIHHCPGMALSLYKNRAVEKVWEKDGDLS